MGTPAKLQYDDFRSGMSVICDFDGSPKGPRVSELWLEQDFWLFVRGRF